MGNKQTNCRPNYCSRFLPEEQAEIDGLFAAVAGGLETVSCERNRKCFPVPISLEMLQAYLGDAIPQKMICRIYDGMRHIDPCGLNSVPSEYVIRDQFSIFMSEILKGNAGEKSKMIMKMLLVPCSSVRAGHIQEFTEDLITSVVHVLYYRNELKGWNMKRCQDFTAGVRPLASQLLSSLKQELNPPQQKTYWDCGSRRNWTCPGECGPPIPDKTCDCSLLEDWLLKVPQISTFLNVIIRRGFLVLNSYTEIAGFIPECKDGRDFMSLLNIPAIIYINSYLPSSLQHTWRLIFSSQIHGYSFAKFCGNIIDRGPCIIVIRDRDGYIFGGFASHSWAVKSHFQGDCRSFLFTIFPNIAVYTYSGYNDHYMYLNFGQQTMPNGLFYCAYFWAPFFLEELNPPQQKTYWDCGSRRNWTCPGECGPPIPDKTCDCSLLEDWLLKVPQISTFLNVIIRRGFLVLNSYTEIAGFIPECKDGRDFMSLLNIPAIIYINSYLPSSLQHTWRLIFSSQIHGYSFAKFCGNIIDRGPCIIVIRDRDGYIFGGFASHSWAVKSHFQGDCRSFLFTIFPNIAVYTYSGYNDHYMYLNFGQQTMPNGLGMGGQLDYFGLWIDCDFGKGHSKANPRCSTYNSPQLSCRENFEIDCLEVWAVGDFQCCEKSTCKKNVLDNEKEVHCLLEMIGKCRHSEGVRNPCDDEDDD
ncbi:MTOR-associated protein MEAK7 [Sarcophilus harrisii]